MEHLQLSSSTAEEREIRANKYNIRCCKITIILSLVMLIGNELRIFIVDKDLLRLTYILINIFLVAPLIVAKVKGINNKYFKYIVLFCYSINVMILNTLLTYHMVLMLGVPFLMAAHYKEKKLSLYVYNVTIAGIIIGVIVGYLYGLTDLNWIYETTGPTRNWNESIVVPIIPLNTKILTNLLLFFAFPRIAITSIYANMGYAVAESVSEVEESKEKIQFESIHDEMTGLYNKKHYEYMKENVYMKMAHIGIIFFDINNLKYVNDNLGHEKGDKLIIMAAQSISNITSAETKGYRIGGDEFLIIVEEPQEGEMQNLKIRWQRVLDRINEDNDSLKCEIAIGIAEGEGINIDEVYNNADKQMYADKTKKKEKTSISDNE